MDYCFRAQLAGFALQFMPQIVMHYRVRHSWEAIYRQSRNWGRDYVRIRRLYKAGIGKLEIPRCLLRIVQLYLKRPQPQPQNAAYAKWLFRYGWEVGGVQGVLNYLWSFLFPEKSFTLSQSTFIRQETAHTQKKS
jgi:hypothetical protein